MALEKERYFSEQEYDSFDHNGITEYDSGRIIAMSPPTTQHQRVTGILFNLISNYLKGKKCEAFIAPFNVRLQLSTGVKRVEPDVSVICDKNKITPSGCEGAPDFIIEVVSPNNKRHDYITKVNWYEQAGVKEYWIVNPMIKQILVYNFTSEDVMQYTFNETVPVSIWEGEFAINFQEVNV